MRQLATGSLVSLFTTVLVVACATGSQPVDTAVPDPAHNSRNSLDWPGTYSGILPCADCEGIQTSITLSLDGRYHRTQHYLGEHGQAFEDKGHFQWDSRGSSVTLPAPGGGSQQYQVGENRLFFLDRDGQRISGDLAANYQLLRENP